MRMERELTILNKKRGRWVAEVKDEVDLVLDVGVRDTTGPGAEGREC